MLELYHNDMSTCSAKVRFALAEKGLDWDAHHLDLRGGDQQKPDYVKLNPNAVVPTLVHDGRAIIESTVINEYLDDAFPAPALKPADGYDQARMRLWTKQLDEGVHAATGVISTGIAFRYQKLVHGNDAIEAQLAKMRDAAKRERMRDTIFNGVDSRFVQGAIQRFDKLLGDMEAALGERGPWLAGADFSLADINYAPYMARLEHLQLSALWHSRPHVADWYTRLQDRGGYHKGIVKWFNAKYLSLMAEKGAEVQQRIIGHLEAA
ncbi:MAG: glutathione S-transferase family protein [Alphaproteobacteria bacterium]